MPKSEKTKPEDIGHETPASPSEVPEGTADPLPEDLGRRDQPVDCAIIGGGPAGLSAAVYLGRLRRSCLVFDDRTGRSLWSQVNRNYLGFPDGIEAAELRLLGRKQASLYGACFFNGCVCGVEQKGDLFCVHVSPSDESEAGSPENIEREDVEGARLGETEVESREEFYASTLIFATGVLDDFPEFEGRDECVGRSLFWCIICDGYEAVGKRVVVIGQDEEAVSTALQLRQFSNTITLVAGQDGFDVPKSRLADLAAAGIEALPYPVAEYSNEAGCLSGVKLEDPAGTVLPLDLIFAICPKQPNTDLARDLGISLDKNGYIKTDNEQKTNLSGVFAAGDATRLHSHQISTAVAEGGAAAEAVNYYLYGKMQKEKSG
ncbi:MAG: NAD(P)/FAD-dependent oxidoreductase [Chloroflexia bacterium]